MTEVRDTLMLGQDSQGRLVERPLSPHLQVYRPQLTSVLSIMNRVTGMAISAGTLLFVWWLAAAATGPQAFDRVQGFIGSPVGLFVLFGWTAALFYHFYAGIRHLAWDAGYGYELGDVHRSGWLTMGATVVSTVLVWAVGLAVLRS